ncbi:hypothetical protein [Streptomyces lonarensis]|uniref:Integral membrane protein n=1 Tax=Streptomyces lonarensis TaxID=700599 RepID=A0A7X6D2S5_9ACTN|nr:hypothetical protein [Streptomyces lonarensis]
MTPQAVPGQRDGFPGPEPRPAMELLVHGVGGATPQQMLGDARVCRVTGDATASVHRRTDDAEDRPWDERDPLREAYSWSNLTSGNGARALWLLLLPFMIVNVTHWMRPAVRGHGRTHHLYDALVRLIALSLTILLVSGACVVALDALAWQCGSSAACTSRTSWFSFAADGGWWSTPGRRLALAALLPTALTALLWWLSHRTWSTYESAYPPVRVRQSVTEPAPLSLPGFWYGRRLVSRLRAAHTAAGLLTVCAALLSAGWAHDHGTEGGAVLATTGTALAAATAAGGAAVLVLVTRYGRNETQIADPPPHRAVTLLPVACAVLLAATAVHTAWERPGQTADGALPGTVVFPVLTVAQGLMIVGLAAAALRLHRLARDTDRTALAGLGGPAVALLSCALAGALTGGATQRFTDWLTAGSETLHGPPVMLSWQAAAIPSLIAVAALLGLVAAVRVRRDRRRLAPTVAAAYPGESTPPDDHRSGTIASALARARLTDSAPAVVGTLAAASLLLGIVAVLGTWGTGLTPSEAAADAPAPLAAVASLSESLGSWMLSVAVLVMIAMGRRAYRDRAARRTIGILWDVGTFWPRAAHPFAPPCYAERAVPDLSWRIATWIDATGGRVVLSGHSQGSVLAAAAVWQLDAPTRSRVSLLTHGSPLARLYGRWFPKYFGPHALRLLREEIPCWRNLWRATDPIGGPVDVPGRDADDRPVDHGPLLDPLHYGRNLRSPLPEPVLGHGDYPQDPAYDEERAHLCHTLRGESDADAPTGRLPRRPGDRHRRHGTAEPAAGSPDTRPGPEPGPPAVRS